MPVKLNLQTQIGLLSITKQVPPYKKYIRIFFIKFFLL